MAPAVEEGGGGAMVPLLRAEFGRDVEPGRSVKEWAKVSPRAKAIDWGNFRKGLTRCDNDGERLFACYEYLAEPFLADDYRTGDGKHSVPVLVRDYPFEVSPLARRNDALPQLTDRFELFVHGRELCNAFSELNDPDDQADRFARRPRRRRGATRRHGLRRRLHSRARAGMPPAAGFGMGSTDWSWP